MVASADASSGTEQVCGRTIDLNRSIPPLPAIVQTHLSRTLQRLSREHDLGERFRAAPAGGTAGDRAAGALWLEPRFRSPLDPSRITVTSGTQSALLLLLEGLVGQNGLLLAEALSYGVLAPLAARAHVRLRGVAVDADGIIPEAFDAACREEPPRALYCNPTDHNPTTATMPETRRLEIAAIARRYGVAIIEDDPLGRLHPDAPRAIAALAPDVTWYIMGLTKCLAHGLRIAYLVSPDRRRMEAAIGTAMRLSYWYPAPLHAAVSTAWIGSGAAGEIAAAIADECDARQRLAFTALAGQHLAGQPAGLHVWLTLRNGVDRRTLVDRLKVAGVLVRPADLFAIGNAAIPNALRLSLSSPPHRVDVEHGLREIAKELSDARLAP